MQRKPPVDARRPRGEDDAERVERAAASRNQVPADGEAAKTKGGKGSGRGHRQGGQGTPSGALTGGAGLPRFAAPRTSP